MKLKYYSWLYPEKLEKDSITDAVYKASKYAKGKLLDVGCGKKPYQYIFQSKVTSYIGIDKEFGDVLGSALCLPFLDNSFNTVLSTQVIEHVEEPFQMMSEIHRVLKKDGFLILTAPLFWCLHEIPNDYYRFTSYSLYYLAKKTGFKIIYIKERGNWLITIGQFISTFLESTLNRTILKYPKKLFQAFVQFTFYKLSKIKRFQKNRTAPLGYVIVAQKV